MKKLAKVYKFQVMDSLRAVAIFYGVILVIAIFTTWLFTSKNINGRVSGYEFASMIFLFVAGLNCFKASFRFTQLFHVSRRSFYAGTLLALLTLAAGMTLIDTAIGKVLESVMEYSMFFPSALGTNVFSAALFEFAMLALCAFVGWMITMVYYRSSKPVKIIISLAPVYVPPLFSLLARYIPGIVDVVGFLLGFGSGDHLMNALGVCVSIVIVLGINFLLIRKAPVKA